MKTLYIDCGMGAAGDMLSAALLELTKEPETYIAQMNALGLKDVTVSAERVEKCGIQGTHVRVRVAGKEEESYDIPDDGHDHPHDHDHPHGHDHHYDHHHDGDPHDPHDHPHDHDHQHDQHDHYHDHDHHHHHASMRDIEAIIRTLPVSDRVREDVTAVYRLIAEAESHVHGRDVSEIHFHEVGTLDAVADITFVCLLMEAIDPAQVIVSPVHVGSGKVRCAHGILPVPAPATAYLLRDIPMYGGEIRGELCTPTGAALLKHFATSFGAMPVMRTHAIGYGCGKKDFPVANCVRVLLGDTKEDADTVIEYQFNVDDMTAEEAGFALERLFEAGALEAYTQTVYMKKNRPGILFTVMSRIADKDRIIETIFRHTTTIGIRSRISDRHVLEREIISVDTPYGVVRKKVSSGYGTKREKWEYEDLARIAREKDISLAEVRRRIGQTSS